MTLCCVKCLKWIVFSSGITTLLVTLLVSSVILKLALSPISWSSNTYHSFVILSVVLGLIMLAIGIVGIIGALKTNRVLLILYTIFTLSLVALFIVVCMMLKIGKSQYIVELQDSCNGVINSGWIYNLTQVHTSKLTNFCNIGCPCNALASSFDAKTYRDMVIDSNGPTSAAKCYSFPTQYYDSAPSPFSLAFVSALENEFKCSGICKKEKFFYFSDVNYGIPQSNCKDKFEQFLDNSYLWVIATSIAASIYFAFASFSTIYLCCASKDTDYLHLASIDDKSD